MEFSHNCLIAAMFFLSLLYRNCARKYGTICRARLLEALTPVNPIGSSIHAGSSLWASYLHLLLSLHCHTSTRYTYILTYMPMYSKCSIGTTPQCMGEKTVILSVVAWCRHTYYKVTISASAASGLWPLPRRYSCPLLSKHSNG